MSLAPGDRVGPYEVTGTLGAGGMGEVYRARDTKLDRDVAIKVLPDTFAADPERVARFEREAKTLAALNHANVGQIYGLEEAGRVKALVLELVEGPTLADQIKRGPIALDQALPVAKQIAEALEAAHEAGIVHRDLKPSNIKVRPDGAVKVLDFGLAKALGTTALSNDASQSPTITTPAMTQVGLILGTAAYMSPEQAKGRVADARSDIWAFGCVLYEMLSGTRAFIGEDVSDTMAAVLRGDPDWSALPRDTPRALVRLLKRCLQRDRSQRLQDIGDARLDIQDILAGPSEEAVASSVAKPRSLARRAVPIAAVATVAGLAVGSAVWALRPAATARTQRFRIVLPEGEVYTNTGRPIVALSRTGTYIVYGANNRLNLRELDQLDPTPIRGTEEGARSPFLSPDGEWVGFWQGGQLNRVALSGGAPFKICGADVPTGVTWAEDGTILYGQGSRGIWRVAAEGGTPEAVVEVGDGEAAHGPQLLPGGDWLLFTLRPKGAGWDDANLVVQSMRSGERRIVVPGGRDGRYIATGHLIYARTGTIFGVPFDLDALRTTGGAIPLVEGVPDGGATSGASQFALSANGTLAYVAGLSATSGTPVWVGRDGGEQSAVTSKPLTGVEHPRVSPDGRRLAVMVGGDLWVHDLEGRPPIRLTHDGNHYAPVWTPDGRRLIYETSTPAALVSVPADGSGGTPVPVSPSGHYHPHAVSPGGGELIAVDVDNATTGSDTNIVEIPMSDKPEPTPLVRTPSREGFEGLSLSPDGRWLAYASDGTGQLEIWVQPYGRPGAPIRVSPNGGVEPVWARNARELFYLEGRRLMAVAVDGRTSFEFSPPKLLFETTNALTGQPPSYDVGADGRFLMIRPEGKQGAAPPIVVVLNWFDEVKRRAPTR